MNPTESAFIFGAHCEVQLLQVRRVALSAPIIDLNFPIREKDLLRADADDSPGKYTIEEHLAALAGRGDIDPTQPLLALGMRNNLVNLRAPIIRHGKVHTVATEMPELSARPYYGIGSRDGRIVLEQALGHGRHPADWAEFFCAGVPVLWDELSGPKLFDLLLAEAADHSHVFELPRGAHQLARAESLNAWERLHRVFVAHVHSELQVATGALREEALSISPPLQRSSDYLHAVIGSRPDGAVVCIYCHGMLESLGEIARSRGCTRAVCVENSGSVMPTFLPQGTHGDVIPLLRAPNFRPRGRVMLVFELASARFASMALDDSAA